MCWRSIPGILTPDAGSAVVQFFSICGYKHSGVIVGQVLGFDLLLNRWYSMKKSITMVNVNCASTWGNDDLPKDTT